MAATSGIAVCAINFWPGFTFETDFVAHLLGEAFGPVRVIETQKDADLVLTSVFPHVACKFPAKTVAIIRENVRPNYQFYGRSISQDFDSYGGRNCRAEGWWPQIDWDGRNRRQVNEAFNHGYEPHVGVDQLLRPRRPPARRPDRFCCYIARNPEPYRRLAVEALSRIGPVDQFGAVADRPLRRSKYEVLPDYRFNLCFENSIFPGYYTEKALQAWVGGCVPLYWSDPWYVRDFNAKALINRIDFPSMEAFVDRVAEVNASPALWEQIHAEPLLLERPRLEGVIDFLQQAVGG